MILEEETYEKFGYYPNELKPQSHKRVLAACDGCEKIREIYQFSYHSLCNRCANKAEKSYMYGRSGENTPRFGQHHLEGTKQKIRNAQKGKKSAWFGKHHSEETKKKMGENHADRKGEKNPMFGKKGEKAPNFDKHPSEETRKKLREATKGENNPRWRGGISFEPYCQKFNNKFKEYIREKFGRICFLCNKTEEQNRRRLAVHHVNYNKSCGCDNDETCQFVPLCNSCNAKVNTNRKEWEKRINAKMQNKLTGWYI